MRSPRSSAGSGPVGGGPLRGLRAIDLSTGVAGPFCARALADYGCEVIKIEPPTGDPARRRGPFADEPARDDAGGLFLHVNANKLGIVVDVSRPEGAAVVRDLLEDAHVLIESGPPGALAAVDLGPHALLAAHPGLVVTSVTPFGQTGPYRDLEMTEIVAFAMGGPMNASGNAAREPVRMAGNVIHLQSGSTAAAATLGALLHALQHGEGQHVDVATFETQSGSLDRRRYYLLAHAYSGFVSQRTTTVGGARRTVGGRFEARDGRLVTTGLIWPTHIGRMVTVLADPELTALHAAKGQAVMLEDGDVVNAAIARFVAARDARQAMRDAQAGGWPVVVVNDPLTLVDDEHLVARGFWVSPASDPHDPLPYCAPPLRFDGQVQGVRLAAPRLGEHTDDVLARLNGYPPARITALRAGGVIQ